MEHPIFIAALVLSILAVLFEMIGMATPVWFKKGPYSAGLYTYCTGESCASYDGDSSVKAGRAFATIGFLTGLAGMIINLVYYCKHLKKNEANRTLPLAAGILFIISGVSTILVTPIVTSGDGPSNLDVGYSLVLSVLGGVMALVTGGLTLFHRTKISA